MRVVKSALNFCGDRMSYTRRKVGTRAKVNWYRGNNARTDNSPPATPDSTTQAVLRERRVQGHDGCRRVPDNQVVEDGKTVRVVERERKPNSKYVNGKRAEYEKRGSTAEFKNLDED